MIAYSVASQPGQQLEGSFVSLSPPQPPTDTPSALPYTLHRLHFAINALQTLLLTPSIYTPGTLSPPILLSLDATPVRLNLSSAKLLLMIYRTQLSGTPPSSYFRFLGKQKPEIRNL